MQSRYSMNQKKKKPYIKWTVLGVLAVLIGAAVYWLYVNDWDVEKSLEAFETKSAVQQPAEPDEDPIEKGDGGVIEGPETPIEPVPELPVEVPVPEERIDATKYPENIELPSEPTFVNGILLANKQHPLPATYAPGENKEARAAFESLRLEALKEKLDLTAFSTYRDFARQQVLYKGYVAKDGQEAADRYSARPGFSEHQTGLAFDIGEAGEQEHWASETFGDTDGGKWLKDNAHRFGFILRYPEGAEQITGYMHESWHFRYVGNDIAMEIYTKGITLEEYLGI